MAGCCRHPRERASFDPDPRILFGRRDTQLKLLPPSIRGEGPFPFTA